MNGRKLEQILPFTLSLIFSAIYYGYSSNNNHLLDNMNELINISLTLSSIALGFIGAIVSVVLSITNSKIMKTIYLTNTDKLLLQYIKESLFVNIATLVYSGYLLLIDFKVISNCESYIWLFLFSYSILCSCRITWVLMSLLKIVNNEARNKLTSEQRYSPSKINLPSNNSLPTEIEDYID